MADSAAVLRLRGVMRQYRRVAVAFSAGVDSTVVAKAAALELGERAVAVTGESPSLADGELDEARALAAQIGIRHVILRTDEFANPLYAANPSNRCYFCKTELYDRILASRAQFDFDFDVIVNGANLDDRGDHRPGMLAATEHAVRSPLIEADLTKADVREIAKEWGLPVWDKPAAPCLSSRLAYGVAVTPERVRRVDAAESFLKELLNIRELRVRVEQNELARIEVPIEILPQLADGSTRQLIVSQLMELGFLYVTIDLAGFRSGSANAVLDTMQLVTLDITGQ